MPRCRCSRNGTTTRSPTTGGRRSRSPAPSTCARSTSTRMRWRSRRAPPAPSTNTCRCARRRRSPAGSTARSPTGRCSTSSCSTCAAIAGRTAPTTEEAYGPEAYFLGPTQIAWLKRELMASRATWKVIAADMPLGLIVVYDGDRKFGSEAVAHGDGPPRGRELEIADLLVVHQARRHPQHRLAHRRRALHGGALLRSRTRPQFQDFEPFWEFVSGPIHAGTFGPDTLDNTFGPQLVFVKAPPKEQITCRSATGCSSSATWRSTARPG